MTGQQCCSTAAVWRDCYSGSLPSCFIADFLWLPKCFLALSTCRHHPDCHQCEVMWAIIKWAFSCWTGSLVFPLLGYGQLFDHLVQRHIELLQAAVVKSAAKSGPCPVVHHSFRTTSQQHEVTSYSAVQVTLHRCSLYSTEHRAFSNHQQNKA